jgi:signal transduction histidine kinase
MVPLRIGAVYILPMTHVSPPRKVLGPLTLPLLGWVVLVAAVLLISAVIERNRLSAEFMSEASILHRLLSQRADQHDAHMTALSALASADGGNRPDLFLQVAITIIRFYPRISAVDLVPLAGSAGVMTTRVGPSTEQAEVLREAALGSDGRLDLRAAPWAPGRYMLIKRSPNTDNARFALAMEVDGTALMEVSGAFWSRPAVHWSLLLPDGKPLAGTGPIAAPRFEKALGSQSQPLVLQADFAPRSVDLLPAGRLATIVLLTTLGYLALVLGLGQYARARRAERQAYLSAQEARLAHASRVNTLGEMASGIAHELTQPLTAILSQAQAARHLSQRGDVEALAPAMQAIADQAKRASAILERLRNWTVPAQDGDRMGELGAALQNVELLLQPEASRRGVALRFDTHLPSFAVRGDQVELEQIVFNLIRNAIEATSGQAGAEVTVSARRAGDQVVVDVSDNGPGIAAEVRDRLFEPFVTGRAGGTGLGLALCQRLAERMGGEVVLVTAQPALFRLRLPIHGLRAREATP